MQSTRVIREWNSLARLPLEGVGCAPLESDVRTWIVNLAPPSTDDASDSGLAALDVALHVEIDFPSTYPHAPPTVWLLHSLPHAHVHSTPTRCWSSPVFGSQPRRRFAVCLDMLSADSGEISKAGHRLSFRGWSSAFTMRSVLVQLRATLYDPRLTAETAAKGTLSDARDAARELVCVATGHMASAPVPVVPTAAVLAEAQRQEAERRVVIKAPVVVRVAKTRPRASTTAPAAPAASAAPAAPAASAKPAAGSPEPAFVVRTLVTSPRVRAAPTTGGKTAAPRAAGGAFAELDSYGRPLHCSVCRKLRPSVSFSRSQREREASSRSCKKCQARASFLKKKESAAAAAAAGGGGGPTKALTKSQLRNARRAQRKQEAKLAAVTAARTELEAAGKAGKAVTTTAPAPAAPAASAPSVAVAGADAPALSWDAAVPPTIRRQLSDGARELFTCAVADVLPRDVDLVAAVRTEREIYEAALVAHAGGGKAGRRARVKVLKKIKALKASGKYQRALAVAQAAHGRRVAMVAKTAAARGGGKLLGPLLRNAYDALVHASAWLSAADVAKSLAVASKDMGVLASDGLLWRCLFAHRFPRAALSASSILEWKGLFKRELHSVHGELVCFHTKRSIVAAEACIAVGDEDDLLVKPIVSTTGRQRDLLRSIAGIDDEALVLHAPAVGMAVVDEVAELLGEDVDGVSPSSSVSVAEAFAFAREEDASAEGVILGAPVEATTNPRTRKFDNIRVFPSELLSHEASKTVRQSTWGEKVDAWLPLYLDEAHYARALERGVLQNALHRLAKKGKFGSGRWSPLDVLEVLPRIMNTHVVLLADGAEKGVVTRAVASYCAVLRLFAALCRTYPVSVCCASPPLSSSPCNRNSFHPRLLSLSLSLSLSLYDYSPTRCCNGRSIGAFASSRRTPHRGRRSAVPHSVRCFRCSASRRRAPHRRGPRSHAV
jgi:ubiquitin-protein ligase